MWMNHGTCFIFGTYFGLCVWVFRMVNLANLVSGMVNLKEEKYAFLSGCCAEHYGDQISVMGKAEGQWVSRFLPE